MAIVTVKNKYQIVIPQALREELGIHRGDVLEVLVERGRLTYIPKAAIDRVPESKAESERFFKKLRAEAPPWLKESWAGSKRRGTDKLTLREINQEVSAVRRSAARRNVSPSA
jgi:AbrB family looped-hinge helix DNA binding protein